MIKPLRVLACAALLSCAGISGCSTSSTPPSAEFVAYTTLKESNQAVDLASQAFAKLYVAKRNENEYSKLVAPVEYAAEKARLENVEVQFNKALATYYAARDAAVTEAIVSKKAGTPMATPAMLSAATAIAQLIAGLKGAQ